MSKIRTTQILRQVLWAFKNCWTGESRDSQDGGRGRGREITWNKGPDPNSNLEIAII